MAVILGIPGPWGLSISEEDLEMLLTQNLSFKVWAGCQALCQMLCMQRPMRILLRAGWGWGEPDANVLMVWWGYQGKGHHHTQHSGFATTDRGMQCGHSGQ